MSTDYREGLTRAEIDEAEGRTRGMLVMTALSMVATFSLASFAPGPMVLATFSGLSGLSAVATSLLALMLKHRPFAPHLTFWDKAAMLALVSICTGLMVDVEALSAYLQAQGTGAGTGAAQ